MAHHGLILCQDGATPHIDLLEAQFLFFLHVLLIRFGLKCWISRIPGFGGLTICNTNKKSVEWGQEMPPCLEGAYLGLPEAQLKFKLIAVHDS